MHLKAQKSRLQDDMLVKRGKVEIINVVDDGAHNIDDEGTREALKRAAEDKSAQDEKKAEAVAKPLEN